MHKLRTHPANVHGFVYRGPISEEQHAAYMAVHVGSMFMGMDNPRGLWASQGQKIHQSAFCTLLQRFTAMGSGHSCSETCSAKTLTCQRK